MNENWKWNNWSWVLVLASLVLSFIFYVSHVHSANASAMNYVSFAGTAVSVVLGVVAIIISVMQSASSARDASVISHEVNNLSNVSSRFSEISNAIEGIDVVRRHLSEGIQPLIGKISDDVGKILMSRSDIPVCSDDKCETEVFEEHVISHLSDFILLFFVYLNFKSTTFTDDDLMRYAEEFLSKIDNSVCAPNGEIVNVGDNIYRNSMLTIVTFLGSLGVFYSRSGEKFTVTSSGKKILSRVGAGDIKSKGNISRLESVKC